MAILETIYEYLPPLLQNVFCSVKGYYIYKRRYNKNFRVQLQNFENNLYNPTSCLRNFLRNISNTPYYNQLFKEYSFDINAENIYEEIKKLPILTKDTVKMKIADFYNPHYKKKVITMKTSGTTGSGLAFPYSVEMENKQYAVWWRYWRWHGIDLNMWCGGFGGRSIIPLSYQSPPFWRIDIMGKRILFSAYHLNQDTIKYYYDEIVKRKLQWLHGYPSQLSRLASLMQEKKLVPLLFVTHITFGAENLLENQKEIIRLAFPNAKLCQHYGLSEGVANISEDINGNLAVDEDFCHVEFIQISKDNTSICRIVGTGFSNEAFPLLRYDTGDIAEVDYLPNGKVKILSIDGRKEDFISLPNGIKLGRLDHIFKNMTTVQEAQIHQKDLYHINVNIVKSNQYTLEDENLLWKEIRTRIHNSVVVKLNYVEKIERTQSGKLRFVISDIR
jgi:phenylacetate-CoA ligase